MPKEYYYYNEFVVIRRVKVVADTPDKAAMEAWSIPYADWTLVSNEFKSAWTNEVEGE